MITASLTTSMAPLLLAGSSTNPLFDQLWQARQEGVEPLEKALHDSIWRIQPTETTELLEYIKRNGWDVPIFRRTPVMQLHQDYCQIGLLSNELIMRLNDKRQSFELKTFGIGSSLSAGVAFWFLRDVATAAFLGLYGGLFVTVGMNYIFPSRKSIMLQDLEKTPSYDVDLALVSAAVAAFHNDRRKELHYLALAAEQLYHVKQQYRRLVLEPPPSFKGADYSLFLMTAHRGSHHAAHYLWLLHQEEYKYRPDDYSNVRMLFDSHLFAVCDNQVVKNSLAGGVVAQDVVNIAVRESSDFRQKYIEQMKERGISPDDNENLALAQRMEKPSA